MKRPLCAAALCVALLAAAGVGTGAADRTRDGCVRAWEHEPGETLLVQGQVYQKDETSIYLKSVIFPENPESSAERQSARESGQSFSGNENQIICQDLFLCEIEQAQEIPLGSTVLLEGIFASFSHGTNPGEFDSAVYYRTLGVGGKLRKAVLLGQSEDRWPLREALYRLKCRLKERLYRIMPEKEAAIMCALLLGDKKDMDSGTKDLYKRNGILHILSISSLHITIIGMSVYKLLRKVGMPVCPAALGGSILLLLYGGITGFGVSACRAIGMYLIKMLGELAGRTYDMLTALGVMGAGMLIVNPFYLQSSGFLLSFGSVLGIGVLYPALAPGLPGALEAGSHRALQTPVGIWGAVKEKLRDFCTKGAASLYQGFFVSLSITLFTMPIQLRFYYEIPTYSTVLNLLVIPLMKPMMIAGLIALGVPGLGGLSAVNCMILQGYDFLCGCFDRLPFHTWNPGCPEIWQAVVYYLLLLGAAVWSSRSKRQDKQDGTGRGKTGTAETGRVGTGRGKTGKAETGRVGTGRGKTAGRKKEGIFRILLLCFGIGVLGYRPSPENSVAFLDVGQGDCILVRTSSGQNYLFDCGSTSRSGVGKYVLIPYLKYHGIHCIDGLFLSHPDADHINGALELLETGEENHIVIRQMILPDIEEEAGRQQFGELTAAAAGVSRSSPVAVGYISAGEGWDCGGAVFTCLHPRKGDDGKNSNAYSECFYVEFRDKDNGKTTVSGEGGKSDFSRQEGRGWTVLLTGDVEGEGEEALMEELKKRQISNISVLKAAHHGSGNATSQELLDLLAPELTVISSGRNNRYGHPHKELLERLESSGTHIVQTSLSGAVTVTCRKGKIRVRVYGLP